VYEKVDQENPYKGICFIIHLFYNLYWVWCHS